MVEAIAVVGIGEDGAAGLAAAARLTVEGADLLVGGERQQAFFPDHPARRVVIRSDIDGLACQLAREADAGQRVVVLASGDPLFFGIGSSLARRLGPDRIRVFPSVSAVQLAFARIGEGWHDATVLSAHGRPLAPVIRQALGSARLAILGDDEHTPARMARELLDAGMEPGARAWVLERLGGPAERVRAGTLADVPAWVADQLSVLVVLRDPAGVRGSPLQLGLADEAYSHQRGQITKAEVRAVSVARLAPRTGDQVWDVGAGSGSVSIEVAALCRPGRVFAIERRPEQRVCIFENIARFGADNIDVVSGEAPTALADLPDPDAVFVGGSGGRLREILALILSRPRFGGRLVLNLATLESLSEATTCLGGLGYSYDLAQISVARGLGIGTATRLAALNPVFVLSTRVAG